MIHAKLALVGLFALLLSGCSITGEGICIDGRDLTYDGVSASGLIRIVDCSAYEGTNTTSVVINNTTVFLPDHPELPTQAPFNVTNQSNVTIEQLPIIKQGRNQK